MSFLDIAGAVLKPVSDFLNKRQEIKAAEHQAKIELIKASGERAAKAVSEGLAADASWEMASLQAHSSGWKDEAVLIMFMIPYVLCFIPSTVKYVVSGFAALATTPTWYQVASVSIFMAVYGIRWWRRTQSDT